jgi:UDP-N-acetylmuramoylalanine--D-glutamate ligase
MTLLANIISKKVPPSRLTLISGTATDKLVTALESLGYKAPLPKETLEACAVEVFARAKAEKGKVVILFSPGAASFGEFLHEFDRGEKWNGLVGIQHK